jgi:hypothetical protein
MNADPFSTKKLVGPETKALPDVLPRFSLFEPRREAPDECCD